MTEPAPSAPTQRLETRDHRLRRLRVRSWWRGMREMDLLLGPFADSALPAMGEDELEIYDAILAEDDQDLYLWLTRGQGAPDDLAGVLRRIAAFHGIA